MLRKLVLCFLLVILSLHCQRRQQEYPGAPTIALVVKTLNNPFFIDLQKGAEAAADSLKLNLLVQAPEREIDVEKQMQIIENLIQRQVDAICLAPSGAREIIPAILRANRAHIPIINVDSRVDMAALQQAGGKIATFIGSDNFEGGRVAAQHMIELLGGQGQIAILEGVPGHETGDQRLRGFHSAIDEQPGIRVVASQTANFERDQGFNVFQNILQAHPDLDGVFACNDMMALGAIEAIAAAGRTEEIVVIGFDAVQDARDAIRRGAMAASVAQHPFEMGRLSVAYAARVIEGEEVPANIPVPIELITTEKIAAF